MAGIIPRVTAIILNFRVTEYTIACVRSLQASGYPSLRVLIVDNNSGDGAVGRLRAELSGVEVHESGANLGYTGGINAGFRLAQQPAAEYLLVLNPDTEVAPGFLSPLVDAMEAHPRAAVACGTIYAQHDRTRVWYAGGHLIPWRGLAVHDRRGEIVDKSSLGVTRSVTFVTGCLAMFRNSFLPTIGAEDERFFLYLDDIELSARIARKGYELLYVPKAVIYHRVEGEGESALKLYYSVRNRLLLIRTAFTGSERIIACIYFHCVILAKLAVWRIASHTFFRASWMGLQDYYRGCFQEGRGVRVFLKEPDR